MKKIKKNPIKKKPLPKKKIKKNINKKKKKNTNDLKYNWFVNKLKNSILKDERVVKLPKIPI